MYEEQMTFAQLERKLINNISRENQKIKNAELINRKDDNPYSMRKQNAIIKIAENRKEIYSEMQKDLESLKEELEIIN